MTIEKFDAWAGAIAGIVLVLLFLMYAIKKIMCNLTPIAMAIVLTIIFIYNDDFFTEFILTVVFGLIFIKFSEMNNLCKEKVIEGKVKKYNNSYPIKIQFNKDFYDSYNQLISLSCEILVYLSIYIPILSWNLFQKINNLEEPTDDLLNFDDYYEPKLLFHFAILITVVLLILLFMKKTPFYKIYENKKNHLISLEQNNFYDDEKVFIKFENDDDYSDDDIKVLNKGEAI